jgi:hypothetical protein
VLEYDELIVGLGEVMSLLVDDEHSVVLERPLCWLRFNKVSKTLDTTMEVAVI